MIKGGYQMLDLTGIYDETGSCTIDGIYTKVQVSKAKLVGGELTGELQLLLVPQYLNFAESSGDYAAAIEIGGEAYTITITSENVVTIAAAN